MKPASPDGLIEALAAMVGSGDGEDALDPAKRTDRVIAEAWVLLLDEPTAGLSPAMMREVYRELARMTSANRSAWMSDRSAREKPPPLGGAQEPFAR